MSFVCQNIYHDTLWAIQYQLPISLHRIDRKEIAETRFYNLFKGIILNLLVACFRPIKKGN